MLRTIIRLHRRNRVRQCSCKNKLMVLLLTFLFASLGNSIAQAQFMGADSFCNEPGEASFTLPAATSTPTPIPTQVIETGGNPPSPEQRTILSGVVLDQSNRPVANAIVYIFDIGITMTDSSGRFAIAGADPNREYAIAIQSNGFEGPIPPSTLRPGSSATLRVVSTNHQSIGGCKEMNIKGVIADNASRVSKIFDRIVRDYERWGQVWPADIETVVQGGLTRARHQLNQYLAASLGVPTVIRTCSTSQAPQCSKFTISEAKRTMVKTATWMRQEALLINQALHLKRDRPTRVARTNNLRIKQLGNNLARTIATRIPSNSYRCAQ
ncbi:MAG: carboxypeptidase-like regulatory domain-containing protein [Pseudomonadota bacterium]|jgi:hypothetical protein